MRVNFWLLLFFFLLFVHPRHYIETPRVSKALVPCGTFKKYLCLGPSQGFGFERSGHLYFLGIVMILVCSLGWEPLHRDIAWWSEEMHLEPCLPLPEV